MEGCEFGSADLFFIVWHGPVSDVCLGFLEIFRCTSWPILRSGNEIAGLACLSAPYGKA